LGSFEGQEEVSSFTIAHWERPKSYTYTVARETTETVFPRKALIIILGDDPSIISQLPNFFEDFYTLHLHDSELYYEESHKVDIAKAYKPIFFLPLCNPVLSSIVASRLHRLIGSFYVLEWKENRFKVLEAP